MVSCNDELAVHSCPLLCLFYCRSLLRSNNRTLNRYVFASSYSSRRFAAYDVASCWNKIDCGILISFTIIADFEKRCENFAVQTFQSATAL